MKKHILLAILIIFATVISGQRYLLGSDGPDTWETMNNSYFKGVQRTAAVFDHDLHNEQAQLEDECAVCHHLYEDGQLIGDESSEDSLCSDCHELKKVPDNSVPLRVAYHKRCKSCHFNKKKGPVLCGECHINKGRSK